MDFSLTVRQSFPCQQPSEANIDIHVYFGVIMGGTTPDPKHNAGRRSPAECVDHGFLRALDTAGAQKPVSIEVTLICTLTRLDTYYKSLQEQKIFHVVHL
ncbi:hypothetical protein PoB_004529900 [Plakobranchus ocellatus]|uniref:Uncharacterized protein n=1 Tax=Plakobranchus ocellatus TaxID=259542 RepID=A0AAV4BKE6_9GAST|nr:hypothetical protein PoB_004529900 [Plakobranchus ocellatus]